jgi:hypothetical protein
MACYSQGKWRIAGPCVTGGLDRQGEAGRDRGSTDQYLAQLIGANTDGERAIRCLNCARCYVAFTCYGLDGGGLAQRSIAMLQARDMIRNAAAERAQVFSLSEAGPAIGRSGCDDALSLS